MSEYIERDALKKSIKEKANPVGCTHIIPQDVYSTVLSIVECEPAVDASEIMRGEWISVNDRLPERGKRVLVYSEYMRNSENGGISVNWGWMCHKKRTDITHWMPLPEPPKGAENEQ